MEKRLERKADIMDLGAKADLEHVQSIFGQLKQRTENIFNDVEEMREVQMLNFDLLMSEGRWRKKSKAWWKTWIFA